MKKIVLFFAILLPFILYAQTNQLAISRVLGGQYKKHPHSIEIEIMSQRLEQYHLTYYHSLVIERDSVVMNLMAEAFMEDVPKAAEKELKMRGSHLAYGFLQLPIVDGTNRYAFFKDERYLSPIDNPTVTVIYMEGPAPLEYLKQKFGQQ